MLIDATKWLESLWCATIVRQFVASPGVLGQIIRNTLHVPPSESISRARRTPPSAVMIMHPPPNLHRPRCSPLCLHVICLSTACDSSHTPARSTGAIAEQRHCLTLADERYYANHSDPGGHTCPTPSHPHFQSSAAWTIEQSKKPPHVAAPRL